MHAAEPIAAVATAPGRGAIGIVRLSGANLERIIEGIIGRRLAARKATFARFRDANGAAIDEGLVLYFPGPSSYTGEDVLEFHGHGGAAVLQAVLRRCMELGARLAEPGEFTRRAYLNDRMNLAQAEAVADLIDAATEAAARAAVRSLQGEFSRIINRIQDSLNSVRVFVEATLDFPEEDVDAFQRERMSEQLAAIEELVAETLRGARQGNLLRAGLTVVIVGPTNVGKSSLINRLCGEEVAIVTPIPGTTRDPIRQTIDVRGVPVHIVDTAGLRNTQDPVEAIGVERAKQVLATADLALVVSDAANPYAETGGPCAGAGIPRTVRQIRVQNKIDLTQMPAQVRQVGEVTEVWVSAMTGAGIELLQDQMLVAAGWERSDESQTWIARERHVQALTDCMAHLRAARSVDGPLELAAEEMRLAQVALSQVTGEMAADDLLGAIFSRFCIGK